MKIEIITKKLFKKINRYIKNKGRIKTKYKMGKEQAELYLIADVTFKTIVERFDAEEQKEFLEVIKMKLRDHYEEKIFMHEKKSKDASKSATIIKSIKSR